MFNGKASEVTPDSLLVAEGIDGIEFRSARCRIQARDQADEKREADGTRDEQPRYERSLHAGKLLALQIDIGRERERLDDKPAEQTAKHTAGEAHHASFDEEKLFYVAIGGAERLQHADFAAALENRHDQRVDDAERGDSKREAAKNSQQQIENGKKDSQAFGSVEQGERAETEIFDFLFGAINQRRRFHAHAEAGIGRFVRRGGTAQYVTQIVDLRGAQCFRDGERNQQAAAAESAES